MDRPGRVFAVEAYTNCRHGTILASAYPDQVTLLLPGSIVVEFELEVFRQMMLRLLIAAYSTPS